MIPQIKFGRQAENLEIYVLAIMALQRDLLSQRNPRLGTVSRPRAYEYSVPWTKIIPATQMPRLDQQLCSFLRLKAWQSQDRSAWNG
jgi:hypothetical protein